MENQGWICLYRKFINWEWYLETNVKIVFLHLLLLANHEDKNWQGNVIKRGQVVISIGNLAGQIGLTVMQTRTALEKLKLTNEITIKTTNKFTVITIEKYSVYQDKEINNNKENNEQNNKQITNEQQTDNKQITTNNNYNNITMKTNNKESKKEKNVAKKNSFDLLIENYTSNITLQNELKNHLKVRKMKKGSLTDRAIELELETLDTLTDSDEEKIKIVRKSIEKGWIGFFRIKESNEKEPKAEKQTTDERIAILKKMQEERRTNERKLFYGSD